LRVAVMASGRWAHGDSFGGNGSPFPTRGVWQDGATSAVMLERSSLLGAAGTSSRATPKCGDQDRKKCFLPATSHPFVRSLRSHPSAPAARLLRRRVERRSRTELAPPGGLVLDGREYGGTIAANGARGEGNARYRSVSAGARPGAALDGGISPTTPTGRSRVIY